MEIKCVWEHNDEDSILYAADFVGAFTRGASKEEAISKMPAEVRRFQLWQNLTPSDGYDIVIVQERESDLQIKDADSDVLFVTEEKPLTAEAGVTFPGGHIEKDESLADSVTTHAT